MRQWIPISTSPKGRLVLAAVREFGSRPFDQVTVGELAVAAELTTGAIYHHFGSKLGLYTFVRADVEQRLLDRMEGAAAGASSPSDRSAAVVAALVVGFDFATREGFLHLLGAPPAGSERDRLADTLAMIADISPVMGSVLAAAWRAAVAAVADGSPPEDARAALAALSLTLSPG
jgi:AcrR family transcriptional regulator